MAEGDRLDRSIEDALTRIKVLVSSVKERKTSPISLYKRTAGKQPKTDPKFKEKDLLEMNPDFQKYRQMNHDLQKKALLEGRRLNKLCKEISPGYEGMIVGHQHKASGILITHLKPIRGRITMFVLLVRENGQLNIPGGKAKEEESPLETAEREFMEEAFAIPEALPTIEKSALPSLKNTIHFTSRTDQSNSSTGQNRSTGS